MLAYALLKYCDVQMAVFHVAGKTPQKNNLHLHRWHYHETVIFINNNNMRVKARSVIYGAF